MLSWKTFACTLTSLVCTLAIAATISFDTFGMKLKGHHRTQRIQIQVYMHIAQDTVSAYVQRIAETSLRLACAYLLTMCDYARLRMWLNKKK